MLFPVHAPFNKTLSAYTFYLFRLALPCKNTYTVLLTNKSTSSLKLCASPWCFYFSVLLCATPSAQPWHKACQENHTVLLQALYFGWLSVWHNYKNILMHIIWQIRVEILTGYILISKNKDFIFFPSTNLLLFYYFQVSGYRDDWKRRPKTRYTKSEILLAAWNPVHVCAYPSYSFKVSSS